MARQRKKLSEAERSYNAQVRRITQFVRRAEKRGYVFNQNVVPQKPKKITKASVRRLEKITPTKLYKKAEYVNYETGEVISGTKARKIERQRTAYKSAQTRLKNEKIKVQQKINSIDKTSHKSVEQEKQLQKLQKRQQKLQHYEIKTPKNIDVLNEQEVQPASQFSLHPEVQKQQNKNSVNVHTESPEPTQQSVTDSIDESEPNTPDSFNQDIDYYDNNYDESNDSYDDDYIPQWRIAQAVAKERQRQEHEDYISADNQAVTTTDNATFTDISQRIDDADPNNEGVGDYLRNALKEEIENRGYHHVMSDMANADSQVWEDATTNPRYEYTGEERGHIFSSLMKLIKSAPLDAKTSQYLSDMGNRYSTEDIEQQDEDKPSRVMSTPAYDYAMQEREHSLRKELSDVGHKLKNELEDSLWYKNLTPQDKSSFYLDMSNDNVSLTDAEDYVQQFRNWNAQTGAGDDDWKVEEYLENMQNLNDEINDINND